MEADFYKRTFDLSPNGLIIQRLLFNANNEPYDFEILAVNKKFETLSGIRREEIVNKKYSEVDLEIYKGGPGCLAEVFSVAINGGHKELEKRCYPKNSKQKVFIYSGEDSYFTTVIYDPALCIKEKTTNDSPNQQPDYLLPFNIEMIDTAAIWINMLDTDGNITMWNKAAERISGYSREEVLGRDDIWQLLYPDIEYRKEIQFMASRIIVRGEQVENFETKIKCKNCSERIISWYSNNIVDNNKNIIGSVAFGTDITERKNAERALSESEYLYKSITDNSFNTIAFLDFNGNYLFCNKAYETLLGYTPTELIGTQGFGIVYSEDREKAQDYFNSCLSNPNKEISSTFRLICKNNSARWFEHRAKVLLNYERTPDKVFVVARDVTEQYLAEEALKSSEEKHRILLDYSNDPIFSFSHEGKYIYVNQAFANGVGKSVENIVGHSIWDVFPPEEAEKRYAVLNYVFNSGEEKVFEVRVPREEGDRYYITTVTPIKNNDGRVNTVICSSKEITDRKKTEDALRESETRFRDLFEKSPDAYLLLVKNKINDCNSAAAHLMGATKEQIINLSPTELSPEYQPDGRLSSTISDLYINKALSEGNQKFEWLHQKLDGTLIWIEVAITSIQIQKNNVLFASWRDINDRKLAEAALIESENRLNRFFELNPLAIMISDKDGFSIKVNKAHTSLFHAVPPATYNFFNDPSLEKHGLTDEIQKVKKGETVYIDNFRYNTKEVSSELPDNELWLKMILFPICKIDGKVESIIVMIENITEKKTAEKALAENETKYKTLIENMNEVVMLVDNNDRVLFVNKIFTNLLGYSPEEIIGKIGYQILLDQEDQNIIIEMNKQRIEQIYSQYEIQFKTKTGEKFDFLVSGAPVVNSEGSVIGSIGVMTNITDRKRFEYKLIESEEKFRSLAENVPGTVYLCLYDNNCTMIYLNNEVENLTGYNKEHFLTDKIRFNSLFHPDDSDFIRASITNALTNKESFHLIYRLKNLSGEYKWIEEYGVGIYDKKGNLLYIEGLMIDITQRKKAEEELIITKEKAETANQLKSEFLAQMSHEIRSPLNVVLSYNSLLKDNFVNQEDDDVKSIFSGIENASKRIIRTIDNILNMTELQLGTYDPIFKEVDLKKVIVDISTEYKNPAKVRNIDLRYNIFTNNFLINTDHYALTQVIANLVDNAIKYTNKGFVEINLKEDSKKHKIIEIKDSGIGMTREFLPKIFEAFSQEQQGYSRKFDGNGLGLALIKKYCDVINANIEVESEKGKGSTFTLIFL